MPFSIYKLLIAAFVIALISTFIGFKKTVWFISLGYTAAIVALALMLVIVFYPGFRLINWLHVIGLVLWGTRLGAFLYQRERNVSYTDATRDMTDQTQNVSFPTKMVIWVAVSALYVCMFSPVLFASLQGPNDQLIMFGGILTLYTGLLLESAADREKAEFKIKYPNSFCNTGLYRWVRSPNYLGEILFWTGNFIIGIPFYTIWWYWIMSGLGLLVLILIMIGSTKRLEVKQAKRYGSDPAFQNYIKTVPVLLPWLPVYSLKDVKAYLG